MPPTAFANLPMRHHIFSTYRTLPNSARSRALHHATHPAKAPAQIIKGLHSNSTPSSTPHENPSLPSSNLFHAIRTSPPPVRYTVYAGLGLMATVESTFWFHVIKATFFPSVDAAEQEGKDGYPAHVSEAIAGYKADWMNNYARYYGRYVWGVGER